MCTRKLLLCIAIVAAVFSILGCTFVPIQESVARPPGEVQIIPSEPVIVQQDPELVAKAIGDFEVGERMVVERMVEGALADYELGERMAVERLVTRAVQEYRAGERAVEALPLPVEAPIAPELERIQPPNVWLTPGRVQEGAEGNIWWSPPMRELNAAPVDEGAWSIYRSGERSLPQAPAPENAWEAYRLGERTAVAPEASASGAVVGTELSLAGSNVSEADLAWAVYRATERTLNAPVSIEDAWAAYRSGERAPGVQPAPDDAEVDLSTW